MILAYIWSTSDSAEFETQVDLHLETLSTTHRESTREHLENCFSKIWQQQARVLFSDELINESETTSQ